MFVTYHIADAWLEFKNTSVFDLHLFFLSDYLKKDFPVYGTCPI